MRSNLPEQVSRVHFQALADDLGLVIRVRTIDNHYRNGHHCAYHYRPSSYNGSTRSVSSRYKFARTHAQFVSERSDNCAEVSAGLIAAHCCGSSRLKLCFRHLRCPVVASFHDWLVFSLTCRRLFDVVPSGGDCLPKKPTAA